MKHPALLALDAAAADYEKASAAERRRTSPEARAAKAAALAKFLSIQQIAEQAGALASLDHALRTRNPGATK